MKLEKITKRIEYVCFSTMTDRPGFSRMTDRQKDQISNILNAR